MPQLVPQIEGVDFRTLILFYVFAFDTLAPKLCMQLGERHLPNELEPQDRGFAGEFRGDPGVSG
jgi:hypothetical protein